MRGAVHNALPTGPISQAFTQAVGDDVGNQGIERYGETLTPILDLWRGDPTWCKYRGDILLATRNGVGATVGETSGAALVNPTGSGVLLTVEAAGAWSLAASLFYLTRATQTIYAATYALVGLGYPRDSRVAWPILFAGSGLIYSGSDAALPVGYTLGEQACIANTFCDFRVSLPVILHPGQGLAMECETANNGMRYYFTWRERKALRGELV